MLRVYVSVAQVKALTQFAKDRFGCSVGQLALAWCVRNKNVSTVLLGATSPEQLKENLGAIAVADKLTDADMKAIDEVLKTKPPEYNGYHGSRSFRQIVELESDKK